MIPRSSRSASLSLRDFSLAQYISVYSGHHRGVHAERHLASMNRCDLISVREEHRTNQCFPTLVRKQTSVPMSPASQ